MLRVVAAVPVKHRLKDLNNPLDIHFRNAINTSEASLRKMKKTHAAVCLLAVALRKNVALILQMAKPVPKLPSWPDLRATNRNRGKFRTISQ